MGLFGLNSKERAIWNMIRPGWAVKITIKDRDSEVYFSRVVSADQKFIWVQTPVKSTVALEVAQKSNIQVEIFVIDGSQIKFTALVLEQVWTPERMIKIACPKSFTKVQLRTAYRLESVLEVRYSVLNDNDACEKDLELRDPVFLGLSRNISTRGCLVLVDRDLEINRIVNAHIKLTTGKIIRAKSKVLRFHESKIKGRFVAAFEFIDQNQSEKDILDRFIFEQSKERSSKKV